MSLNKMPGLGKSGMLRMVPLMSSTDTCSGDGLGDIGGFLSEFIAKGSLDFIKGMGQKPVSELASLLQGLLEEPVLHMIRQLVGVLPLGQRPNAEHVVN